MCLHAFTYLLSVCGWQAKSTLVTAILHFTGTYNAIMHDGLLTAIRSATLLTRADDVPAVASAEFNSDVLKRLLKTEQLSTSVMVRRCGCCCAWCELGEGCGQRSVSV